MMHKISLIASLLCASSAIFAQTPNYPLQSANNLSDVASASTSRTNLGLGSSSTVNTGTSGATIPLLNGVNTWSGAQTFGAGVAISGSLISATAPTIASGFGTSAAIVHSNGTAAFALNVGTSNTGNGVLTLPTAANGWTCDATDITTTGPNQLVTKQTASSATSATLQNYTDAGATHAWTDSDVLYVKCLAY